LSESRSLQPAVDIPKLIIPELSNNERSSIPITVRQLEAIIRISESLAKVTLNTQVTEHHVDEAMRLFKVGCPLAKRNSQ
jgi:DNA replicative helicase MCM subunit Mcm2 (Cdc46/Mcm family)